MIEIGTLDVDAEVRILLVSLLVFMSIFFPMLKHPVLQCICFKSKKQLDLEAAISDIKQHLATCDIQRDFVKVSRLKRKLLALEKESASENERQQSLKYRQLLWVNGLFEAIGYMLLFIPAWVYRNYFVVVMPVNWVFPLNFILKWPLDTDGSVSVVMWILLLRIMLCQVK